MIEIIRVPLKILNWHFLTILVLDLSDFVLKIGRRAFSLFSISLLDHERPPIHVAQFFLNLSQIERFFSISKAVSSLIRSKLEAGEILKISQSQKLNLYNSRKTKKAM